MASANLTRVHLMSVSFSRSPTKMLNRRGPRTDQPLGRVQPCNKYLLIPAIQKTFYPWSCPLEFCLGFFHYIVFATVFRISTILCSTLFTHLPDVRNIQVARINSNSQEKPLHPEPGFMQCLNHTTILEKNFATI